MTIFFQTNTIGDIFKNILAPPIFIMVVNGGPHFEAKKKLHPSIIKVIHMAPVD